jgi:hypothetical protein
MTFCKSATDKKSAASLQVSSVFLPERQLSLRCVASDTNPRAVRGWPANTCVSRPDEDVYRGLHSQRLEERGRIGIGCLLLSLVKTFGSLQEGEVD